MENVTVPALIGMILLRVAESIKLVLHKKPAISWATPQLVLVEFFRFG